ncbi:MAG: hypothetical protein JNN27_11065 [Planctomycetes bacterium]|nr:hypothetical protein [Planctomycetota bacterium]
MSLGLSLARACCAASLVCGFVGCTSPVPNLAPPAVPRCPVTGVTVADEQALQSADSGAQAPERVQQGAASSTASSESSSPSPSATASESSGTASGAVSGAVSGATPSAQEDARDSARARPSAESAERALEERETPPHLRAEVFSDPVEWEWSVREYAADFEARAGALFAARESEDPQLQRFVLEVLARVASSSPALRRSTAEVAVAYLLGQSDSSVRADVRLAQMEALCSTRTGVRLTDCWPAETSAAAVDSNALASAHASPRLREASARALRFSGANEAEHWLLELSADSDPRVRAAAVAALALRIADGAAPPHTLVDLWRTLSAPGGRSTQLEALLVFEAARLPHTALDALAQTVREEDSGSEGTLVGGALEALRIRAGAAGDDACLLAAWLDGSDDARALRGMFLRAAREDLARGGPLAALVGERLAGAPSEERFDELFEIALEALDPRELAALALRAPRFDEARRAQLWERLRGRAIDWTPAQLAPWLDPSARELETRRAVTDWIGAAAVARRSPVLENALCVALQDPSLDVAWVAFIGLCDVDDAARWDNELHVAWRRFDEDLQLELAARLPRSRPLAAFRGDVLRLGALGGDAQRTALELAAPFGPDAELATSLAEWIERARSEWSSEPVDRAAELRLAGLARTYAKLAPDGGEGLLEQLTQWAAGRSDEVGKVALALLGRRSSARARLESWLAAEVPSRLRIEAALALAAAGQSAAGEWLRRDFATSDLQLKGRTVDALGVLGDEPSRAFLAALALDPRAEQQLRLRALEVAARLEPPLLETLAEATRDRQHELALGAWKPYLAAGGDEARAALRARIEALRAAPPDGDSELRAAELGELFRRAAEAALFDDGLVAAWRARLDTQAAADLRERFDAQSEPRVEFSYGPELAYGRRLARERRLLAALTRDEHWRTWDASALEALGAAAAEEGDDASAQTLLEAAHVALLGEPRGTLRENRLFALRFRQLALAEQRADWAACEHFAAELFDAVRTRNVGERTFERLFGGLEPRERVDGVARLGAALHLARARVALAAGSFEAASAARDAAATFAARSAVAEAALASFDRESESRAPRER